MQFIDTERYRGVIASLYDIGLTTYTAWRQDRTMRLGAGLAYYALFTIVPLVLLTIALGARILDNQDVEAYIA
ncbi:MAG: hypothetical protein GY926_11615, partial [bacterium]|nr:hypothetical protein [bacterium]